MQEVLDHKIERAFLGLYEAQLVQDGGDKVGKRKSLIGREPLIHWAGRHHPRQTPASARMRACIAAPLPVG